MSSAAELAADSVPDHAAAARSRSAATDLPGVLAAVRDFLAKRGRVLYGGIAIDYALRLVGSELYPPDQLPDYDAFSPDTVGDALDLAAELVEAGCADVNVIRAIHVQTLRVRVGVTAVADLSYLPPALEAGLPVLEYRGLRILHPAAQRGDMHLAFCFPFANAPREDVFHRWPKDAARLALLDAAYPAQPAPGAVLDTAAWTPRAVPAAAAWAVAGCAHYAVLCRLAADLLAAAGATASLPPAAAALAARVRGVPGAAPALDLPLPAGEPFEIYTDRVETALAILNARAQARLRPQLDLQAPVTLAATPAGPVAIHSTAHRLLAAVPATVDAVAVWVPTAHAAAVYFIARAFAAGVPAGAALVGGRTPAAAAAAAAYAGYVAVRELTAAVAGVLGARSDGAQLLNATPFGAPVSTLPAFDAAAALANCSHAYAVMLSGAAKKRGFRRVDFPPNLELLDLDALPGNVYFDDARGPAQAAKARADAPAVYASALFARDGGVEADTDNDNDSDADSNADNADDNTDDNGDSNAADDNTDDSADSNDDDNADNADNADDNADNADDNDDNADDNADGSDSNDDNNDDNAGANKSAAKPTARAQKK